MAMLFSYAIAAFAATNTTTGGLNVTAIAARDGRSVLECWTLCSPPSIARGASNYPIGDFAGGYIGAIPPRTYIGQAWAPFAQYSIVLSGLVHITLPNSTQEAWVQSGKYGITIAADLKNVSVSGHITDFPSSDETVIVQLPFVGNEAPAHEILHDGACYLDDLIGI